MRHRMISGTGLGNPAPCLLNNQWDEDEKLNNTIKAMLSEGISLWFTDLGGCDFDIHKDDNGIYVFFGYEPAYMYEKLRTFFISSNANESFKETGIAFGAYGSGIRKTLKRYDEYKKHSKFTNFVDKWSAELQKCR